MKAFFVVMGEILLDATGRQTESHDESFFLDGSVESFEVSVLVWRMRMDVPMEHPHPCHGIGEEHAPLRSVVSLHNPDPHFLRHTSQECCTCPATDMIGHHRKSIS